MPSTSKKPWDRGGKERPQNLPLRRILIICEDSKSSVLYLKKFPVDPDLVQIEYEGTGMNTDSLMEEAIRRKTEAIREKRPYNKVWVVFDRDDFPPKNFNRAFDLASSHREVTACWTNECFELWYLLHFQYLDTEMDRDRICTEVGKKIGRSYEKNDGTVYEVLESRLPVALRNADRLYQSNTDGRCHRQNPSTNVHQLIRMLKELDPEKL